MKTILKNKKFRIASGAMLVLIAAYYMFSSGKEEKSNVFFTAKRGRFEINVFTTGELEAKNSVNIQGPTALRSLGIWQVKISDLVPEGTVVAQGDYIADLDKTELSNKLREAQSELQKIESQYTQIKLDTTLQLRQARDEIANLEFSIKEKQIVVEQSQFEPPATIRQATLDLEKTERSLVQAKKNYSVKQNQAVAKMNEINASLMQTQSKLEQLNNVMTEFTIIAPEDGMVIYQREWNGKKKTVGSTISGWDPTVATLPDLSVMISRTYVNEVDIRKLSINQKVNISLDAFPEKKLTGKVVSVANVGEQNPKSDAKVFEVNIQVDQKDTTLRPAMTTGNNIVVDVLDNVLFVPLEAIHTEDSLTFVYVKNGFSTVKKEVETGQSNENFVVIKQGVNESDEVYLSIPSSASSASLVPLEKKKKVERSK